ncbi:hypothetical protein ACTFIY_003169 [Dictyostelium cf. discoideum]
MDNIIYFYLINNNNKNNEELLNCLLILSINNLNITFNQLKDYCNSINNCKNNNQNLQNKKKKILQEEEEKKHLIDLKGLNDQQFQTLNNHIQNLKNTFTSNNSNHEIIYTHSITDNNNSKNNNNDTINNRNKRIAFDCSILIIIKNNLNHITNNNNNNKYGNNLNQLILKPQPHLNNKIKTNQKINQTIDNNYLLFKKVWGNIFIRDQILFHLRIYNNHNNSFDIKRNNISTYKYKNYFNNVKLLSFNGSYDQRNSNCYPIPQIVEKIEMRCSDIILGDHWIPDTCKYIIFSHFNQKLTRNIIGSSLTSIDFGNQFNQSLSDTNGEPWLPRSLKYLTFGKLFQHSIHRDEIPPSLTSLILDPKYKGVIQYGSIPKSVTTLHYSFDPKDGSNKLDSTSIPGGTTSLEFDSFFNQTIEKGMIPHNVTSLKFGFCNSIINSNSLPISIKTLHLGSNENSFPQDVLPPTITNLSAYTFSNIKILPKTIQKLNIMNFNPPSQLGNHSFYFLKNLTSLNLNAKQVDLTNVKFPPTITKLTLIVSDDFEFNNVLLPNNLKKLKLHDFNQPINVGDLPSSIELLKLPSYKQPIQRDVLPSSLTLLGVSDFFDSTIDRDALPSNLKSFYFTGYRCKEFPDLIWPPSFEFIYICGDSLNFINSIPLHFFIKHVKLLQSE